MSEHVGNELADLVAGRCTAERRREIENHLRECAECAAERTWVERLRDDAIRVGLGHLPAARLVALAADGAAATPLERQHLDACEECGRELAWARDAPDPEMLLAQEAAASTAGRARPSWRRWAWPALATAVAAVALVLFVVPREPTRDFSGLARLEPLPVETTRDTAESGSFEGWRALGLSQYKRARFVGARESLRKALAYREDDTVSLYLASSEILLGRLDEAAERLEKLESGSVDPFVKEEAAWQLANVDLARGRGEEAQRMLEQVVAVKGDRAPDAQELLDAISSGDE